MSSKQTNNLFISTSVSQNFTALESVPSLRGHYRLLIQALSNCHINRIESIEYTGRLLASLARKAQLARRIDVVRQATQLMLAMPLSEQLKGVAIFYQGICKQGDFESDRRLFERAAEKATPRYRARALECIGATLYHRGNIDEALPFYLAAGKASIDSDPLTLAESQKMIAVIRSIYGDHKHALNDLENLFPLVRVVSRHYPALYYDYLNSLAVEFGEVGRIAEAESAISVALLSPFALVYPEWSETREEIEQKRNYPDLSHCFLERSFIESEATQDSMANASVGADPELQTRRETEKITTRTLTTCQFIGQLIYQRPVALPNTDVLVIPRGSFQSILDLLGRCIQPRAPPYSLL